MKKLALRKSDIKELNEKLKETYGADEFLSKKDSVEIIDDKIITQNSLPAFFYVEDKIVPTLKLILEKKFPIKKVTVDMGAVKFVVSGADIMRPGIVQFDEKINKDDFVAILDIDNKKPLAIGRMLMDGETAKQALSGKVIKNIHHVGDELWKA